MATLSAWTAFGTAFTTVFVAELGDRTQLSLLLASSQVRRPAALLLSAILAFSLSSAVAASLGAAAGALLPREYLLVGSGLLFVAFGLWLGVVFLRRREEETEEMRLPERKLVLALTLGILLAELGDKTQVATGLLAATHEPWAIFAGATLALFVQAAIAVALGTRLRHLPPQLRRWLLPVAALVFFGFGVRYLVQGTAAQA